MRTEDRDLGSGLGLCFIDLHEYTYLYLHSGCFVSIAFQGWELFDIMVPKYGISTGIPLGMFPKSLGLKLDIEAIKQRKREMHHIEALYRKSP